MPGTPSQIIGRSGARPRYGRNRLDQRRRTETRGRRIRKWNVRQIAPDPSARRSRGVGKVELLPTPRTQ